MPTKQNPYPSHKNTVIPNPHRRKRSTIPAYSYGLNHRTTYHQGKRRHTDHRGPRVLTCSNIPTMQHHHHGTQNCPTIPRSRVQVVWAPYQDNQRPRPSIHITLWKGIYGPARNTAEPVNGVPPPNRWPFGKKESMGRAIPPFGYIRSTRRLDTVASTCLGSSQQPKKRHYWPIAQSNPTRLRHCPKPWNYATCHQRVGRRKNPNHVRKTCTSYIGSKSNCGKIRNTVGAV